MGTYPGAAAQDSERLAGLSPPWVSAVRWLSAAAHVLVLFTLAQRGPFAADGIIAGLVPLTTVIWILALAATLPRSRRATAPATSGTGGRARARKDVQLPDSPPCQDFADPCCPGRHHEHHTYGDLQHLRY